MSELLTPWRQQEGFLVSELLTPVEVCELLRVRPRTLEDWRLGRSGPNLPFVRLGRSIRYRRNDVQRLIDSSVHNAQGSGV